MQVCNPALEFGPLVGGRRIIASIDKLHALSAIPLKLRGFKEFLELNPSWIGRVTLVQYGISTPSLGKRYEDALKEINTLVSEINETFPDSVSFVKRRDLASTSASPSGAQQMYYS